ncbi:MAG: hypothetical protein N3A38_08595 [Planctomycetota bacterium]|nr:hypothetical protein [Planctomycetota bacterium]
MVAGEAGPVGGTLGYSERAFESLARASLRRVPGISPARRGGGLGYGDASRRWENVYVHCSGLSERTVAFEVEIAVDGRERIVEVAERVRRKLALDVYRSTGKRCIVDIRVVDVWA